MIMKNRVALISSFGNASGIEVIDQTLPLPASGQVRVKVQASTVSATDIFIRKGIYPLLKEKPPFTLGYDFMGRIDCVAPDVQDFVVGDRVCGIIMTGGNADYVCCSESILTRVPEEIESSLAACATLSGITAYQMFTHYAKVKTGERILIHGGSGAIGDTLLQLGKLHQCHMITTASVVKHSYIKKSYGAVTLDYHDKAYWNDLELVALNGFDVVFDFTNQKSFNTSFRYLKKGGRLVTYAVYSSSLSIKRKTMKNFLRFGLDFALMMLKLKCWNILPNGKSAKFYGSSDSRDEHPARHAKDMNDLFQLIKEKRVLPLVHEKFKLEAVAEAHRLLESGQVHGQIVIDNSL